MKPPPREVGDRAFAVDAATVALVSLFICLFSQRLALMSVLVPLTLGARLAVWLRLPRRERDLGGVAEVVFFALATLLGAFNDWNSVTRHRIYDYTVPTDLPGLSHIPTWMLLYWGMILRFVLTLFHWRRLGLGRPGQGVWWSGRVRPSPAGRVAVGLGLVLATRQCIYRLYTHPLGSWLPFALAMGVALRVLRPGRRRLLLLAVALGVGPAVELLYIHVGHLHAYHLGWLLGVPLWIALWWALGALVREDLGTRLMDALERVLGGAPARP